MNINIHSICIFLFSVSMFFKNAPIRAMEYKSFGHQMDFIEEQIGLINKKYADFRTLVDQSQFDNKRNLRPKHEKIKFIQENNLIALAQDLLNDINALEPDIEELRYLYRDTPLGRYPPLVRELLGLHRIHQIVSKWSILNK